MSEYKDFPLDQVVSSVAAQLRKNPHLRFFQKFTCANCGNRLTMDVPNQFFEEGGCDKCGHITDIRKQGCNHLMFITGNPESAVKFDEILKKVQKK